jgi:CubicO group peptidase (beta-lactamase class C family)
MSNRPTTISRRDALGALGTGMAAIAAQAAAAEPKADPAQPGRPPARHLQEAMPQKGKAGPGLEELEEAVLDIMGRHGIPGGSAAIAKDGKLVLAKGYGWADVTTGRAAEPDTPFFLASLSKTITAVAALKLVDDGKLGLDDRVFDIIPQVKPLPGRKEDPRVRKITVRQCLNHSAGWNRNISGDPVTWQPTICRQLKVLPPISATQLLSVMLSLPLDFDPGTQSHYSNVGYIAVGEVIAKVTGQAYGLWVQQNVLKPMGAGKAVLDDQVDGKYVPNCARRHVAGTTAIIPPLELPMQNATGGWIASALDVIRFLTALDGSRGKPFLSEKSRQLMIEPPPKPLVPEKDGSYKGLGWDTVVVKGQNYSYLKDGHYPGARTFMRRRIDGINWVILFNASMNFDDQDIKDFAEAIHEIQQRIAQFGKYPDVDLFKEFP